MTYRLGLTGGIGMGKSTTAQMFRDLGHPVWDADEAVTRLYSKGGAAVVPVSKLFPDAFIDGAISKPALVNALKSSPDSLYRLESIVHPLVFLDRKKFLDQNRESELVVLDIPLLFENGSEAEMDGVAVVSVDAETQRARVMARPGMTEEKFRMILARQMPDAEKRKKADWIIPTSDMNTARSAVEHISARLTQHA